MYVTMSVVDEYQYVTVSMYIIIINKHYDSHTIHAKSVTVSVSE